MIDFESLPPVGEREELIYSCIPLAIKIASANWNCSERFFPTDERIGCAMKALCQAADRFNPENNVKFSTYVGTCIKLELITENRKRKSLLGMPVKYDVEYAKQTALADGRIFEPVEAEPEDDPLETEDFIHWLKSRLNERRRQVLEDLLEGLTGAASGRRRKLSRERIRQMRAGIVETARRLFAMEQKRQLQIEESRRETALTNKR